MNRGSVSVVIHLLLASSLCSMIGCGGESKKEPWRKGFAASCRSLGDEPWRREYCECMGTQMVEQLNWNQLDAADVKLFRIMNERYSSTCMPRDRLNQQWKDNFIKNCSTNNSETWITDFCGCIADQAIFELSPEQREKSEAVTKIAKKYASSCLPKDVVDKQWTAAFVESCTDAGKEKSYCQCAAEKATSAWTSAQLTDPEYTSAHIKELAKDCK